MPALEALATAEHELAGVLTQPDRPAGRGLAPTASPVKQCAERHAFAVLQPTTLKDLEVQAKLRALHYEVMVVAAYGLILPQAVLDIPRRGALNIHASLLPRWRGAAPIERALLAGDPETGVCIVRMEAGLDTGPVVLRAAVPILASDTAGTLHDKLAPLGARLAVDALDGLARGTLREAAQPSEGVTYAPKIVKSETRFDWALDATVIERAVRAFNPAPGATARLRGTEIKIWRASVVQSVSADPGLVLAADAAGVTVACGRGALRLEALQRAGGKRLNADEFLRGFRVAVGDRFEPRRTMGSD